VLSILVEETVVNVLMYRLF